MSTVVRSRGTVTIDVESCKGCDLCIPACPPAVLTMSGPVNKKGYHYPELHPGCTGCAACLMVCPDYCFEVFRFDVPVEHEVSASEPGPEVSASEPGPERPGAEGAKSEKHEVEG